MEDGEPKRDTFMRILQHISDIIEHIKYADSDETSPEAHASPEEGARLIRAFIRIKRPELRAALIELTTQTAELKPEK
jgi:hypothetical protein